MRSGSGTGGAAKVFMSSSLNGDNGNNELSDEG